MFSRLLEKAGIYSGKGKRTGSPGNYEYNYDDESGKSRGEKGEQPKPDKLPDSKWKYFTKPSGTIVVSMDKLSPTRARPTGIANANKYMKLAYEGKMDKRKPLSLRDNGNGTYTVLDGNSTFANAKASGWKDLPGIVVETKKSLSFAGMVKAGGVYSGKGKRTGSPGNYKYDYDEPKSGKEKHKPLYYHKESDARARLVSAKKEFPPGSVVTSTTTGLRLRVKNWFQAKSGPGGMGVFTASVLLEALPGQGVSGDVWGNVNELALTKVPTTDIKRSLSFAGMVKSKPYQGKGKRTGSPGKYEYHYEEEGLKQYKLAVVGDDKKSAVDIAKQIAAGIEKSADICKMRPPVCKQNMGIVRDDMPQLLDEPIKDMLKSKDEKDRKKGEAAVAAGADPKESRSLMEIFLANLREKGVKIGDKKPGKPYEKVAVGHLKATQKEIKAGKTFGMADSHLKGTFEDIGTIPIIVTKDNYILDGHHRWSALLTIAPDREMNVIRVDMGVKEIMKEAFATEGVFRADIQDNIVPQDKKFTSENMKFMNKGFRHILDLFKDARAVTAYQGRGRRTGTPGHYHYEYGEKRGRPSKGRMQITDQQMGGMFLIAGKWGRPAVLPIATARFLESKGFATLSPSPDGRKDYATATATPKGKQYYKDNKAHFDAYNERLKRESEEEEKRDPWGEMDPTMKSFTRLFRLFKSAQDRKRTFNRITDIYKARFSAYQGRGRRTGTPGHYKYTYEQTGAPGGRGREEDPQQLQLFAPRKKEKPDVGVWGKVEQGIGQTWVVHSSKKTHRGHYPTVNKESSAEAAQRRAERNAALGAHEVTVTKNRSSSGKTSYLVVSIFDSEHAEHDIHAPVEGHEIDKLRGPFTITDVGEENTYFTDGGGSRYFIKDPSESDLKKLAPPPVSIGQTMTNKNNPEWGEWIVSRDSRLHEGYIVIESRKRGRDHSQVVDPEELARDWKLDEEPTHVGGREFDTELQDVLLDVGAELLMEGQTSLIDGPMEWDDAEWLRDFGYGYIGEDAFTVSDKGKAWLGDRILGNESTPAQIEKWYDANPDARIADIARITQRTTEDVKRILMAERPIDRMKAAEQKRRDRRMKEEPRVIGTTQGGSGSGRIPSGRRVYDLGAPSSTLTHHAGADEHREAVEIHRAEVDRLHGAATVSVGDLEQLDYHKLMMQAHDAYADAADDEERQDEVYEKLRNLPDHFPQEQRGYIESDFHNAQSSRLRNKERGDRAVEAAERVQSHGEIPIWDSQGLTGRYRPLEIRDFPEVGGSQDPGWDDATQRMHEAYTRSLPTFTDLVKRSRS
jgi:hypothetical protein